MRPRKPALTPEQRAIKLDLQRRRYAVARLAGIDVYTAGRMRGNARTFCLELRKVGVDPHTHGQLAARYDRHGNATWGDAPRKDKQ